VIFKILHHVKETTLSNKLILLEIAEKPLESSLCINKYHYDGR